MILNEKSCALHFLQENDPMVFSTNGSLEALDSVAFLRNEFKNMRPLFRKKVLVISDAFFNAYAEGRERLDDIDVVNTVRESGTLVKSTGAGSNTVFYDLVFQGGHGEWDINGTLVIFNMIKDAPEPCLVCFVHKTEQRFDTYVAPLARQDSKSAATFISMALSMVLFIKNCVLENKLIPAGGRCQYGGMIYENKTKTPVEVLHCLTFNPPVY